MRARNGNKINLLFNVTPSVLEEYRDPILAALARRSIDAGAGLLGEIAPEDADYIIHATGGPIADFAPFTNARAVLSLWAGVEKIVGNTTLTQPLCRMVDDGLRQGMVEWVVGHVLRAHLGMDRYVCEKPRTWEQHVPPLAGDRSVTVLGLGELGAAAAKALAQLGFRVTGWSRSPREVAGIRCLAGPDSLPQALAAAEILVGLLPQTPETIDLLNAERLALLPRGSFVVNAGRGTLIVDAALIAALDSGQIARATLDVFRTEPVPQDHPFWSHPGVTISPHIAAATRASTAAEKIAENVARAESGQPLLHVVNRALSY
ncbi:glyoxylate/hydroxypyruvate reductase A [Rhodopseudomonas boonkerdii]|uniref:NAD(P)-dependent oxidoreductase n=1 Tax=Rhodopseudomonas boonkerdii TaxID=475937 RepID=UPI001E2D2E98|nr:NAD(P)-dependent oxidoreductase [Rhodopseudomonas boonkerdii]UGV26020.1 glyoxylate/hydroxypyruvate reductase A [Rhodopseudomonas boonkerdii]